MTSEQEHGDQGGASGLDDDITTVDELDLEEIGGDLTKDDYSTIKLVKAHAKAKGVSAVEALDDLLTRGLLDAARVGVAVVVYLAAVSTGVGSVLAVVGSIIALHKLRQRVSPKKDDLEEELEQLQALRQRLKKVPTKEPALAPMPS